MSFDDRIQPGSILMIKNTLIKQKLPKEALGDFQTHPCIVLKRNSNRLITVAVTTSSPGLNVENFVRLSDGKYVNKTTFQITESEYDENHEGLPTKKDVDKAREITQLLGAN